LVSPKKTRATQVSSETRGGGGPGEFCLTAIPAVIGINNSDGPATGGGCQNCSEDAANADWFVYTPSGPGVLTVSSCLGGADTRLWVYETTTGCSDLDLVAGNDDFCEATVGGDEYASSVEITVCAGRTYYFEWDDNWENGAFTFNLAFVPIIGAELALSGRGITEYTHMPRSAGVINATAAFRNNGSVALTNVNGALTVTKNGSAFASNSAVASPSMVVCSGSDFDFPVLLTQETGNYIATVNMTAAETELNNLNNSFSQSFVIDTSFARDNGTAFGTFGIGTTGVLGQTFFLPKADKLTSVSIKLADEIVAGSTLQIQVFATDATGKPVGAMLGSTTTRNLLDSDTTGWLTLPLTGGPLNLPAGGFFIGFAETADDLTLPVGITDNLYTPQVWANVPGTTAGFEELADVGFGGIVFLLRANFGQTYNWSSVNESEAGVNLILMPNPTSGIINLMLNNAEKNTRVSILDATGKIVLEETIYGSQEINHALDLSAFAQGVYTVRVVSGSEIMNRKIILAK
jgi:hypothetical protein